VELNWSTFILEVINFLVLLWLLKRFLYRPVLGVIAKRRESIAQQVEDARVLHREAGELKARFENRLSDWDQERQRALASLNREIEAERGRRLAAVDREIAAAEEKHRVLVKRQEAEAARQLEERAMEAAAGFAAKLLRVASGPELEQRLVQLVIEQFAALSDDERESLRHGLGNGERTTVVASAYPLDAAQRETLRGTLSGLAPECAECRFEEDANLLAGLRITVGSWRLGLNLQDELAGFVRAGALS
jgi:F-type H+-transporting ATPase subunit b